MFGTVGNINIKYHCTSRFLIRTDCSIFYIIAIFNSIENLTDRILSVILCIFQLVRTFFSLEPLFKLLLSSRIDLFHHLAQLNRLVTLGIFFDIKGYLKFSSFFIIKIFIILLFR